MGTGISGMGRIGRLLVRRMFAENEPSVKLTAINSIYPAETVKKSNIERKGNWL